MWVNYNFGILRHNAICGGGVRGGVSAGIHTVHGATQL